MAKARKRGVGYGGLDSARPTQPQEGDASTGGTAPGGTVAFMGAASQWGTSNAANRSNFPTPGNQGATAKKADAGNSAAVRDPITAAKMQHYGLADESPAEKGDVPIHPGLQPGLFRTARDANYAAPDGEGFDISQGANDPTSVDGRPSSPAGRHRGESPEVLKQTRGAYRP
jgi:hypothetical protein